LVLDTPDQSDIIHLILEGRVKATVLDPDGKEVIRSLGAGDVLQNDNEVPSASIVALEPSRFLILSRRDFDQDFGKKKGFVAFVIEKLVHEAQEYARELMEAQQQKTAISEILRSISRSPANVQSLLEAVVENAARLCGTTDAGIMRVDGNELVLMAKYGPTPIWPVGSRVPVTRGLVTGRSVIDHSPVHVHDLLAAEAEFPEGAATARKYGQRTVFATPLMRGETAIGSIFVRRFEVRPLTDKQIELVVAFADQAAIAIENVRLFNEIQQKSRQVEEQAKELAEWNAALEARVAQQVTKIEQLGRIEHELELAGEIQKSMLPRSVPRLEGYEFGACMIPAKSVGGDFYDFIPMGDDFLGIAIGDVSGKGIPAALFMAMVRSLLRAEAHTGRSPEIVLRSVSRHLMDMNDEMFVTVLFGVLNRATGQFDYVRAGHEPPIFCDGKGAVQRLAKSNGQALGVVDEIALDVRTVTLSEGCMLVLYSDGLSDATNPQDARFGYDGVVRTIGRLARSPAQRVCDELVKAVADYQAGALQHDDITVVVMRAARTAHRQAAPYSEPSHTNPVLPADRMSR
jgi:serine phosphatase RsbU (regulator of sigma subunit)/CRP-like cAMP-binding protein